MDERLLGVWKSDLGRTLKELRVRADWSEDRLARLKKLFGKLEVRYTRRKYYTSLDNRQDDGYYRVLGSDSSSVVIQYQDRVLREPVIRQIHFEQTHYWIWCGFCREWFKRID